ncbi:MAG: hypothetical protein CMJ31_09750 [Phycisphaerae bacterium]|nr:hypothetical protein [Phycisphaerae bacterium]
MPWTLWRSYMIELWRLVLISTATLVVVIAFAAAVKPLADGELDAGGALRFMAFATVPMLAYALPFASGFAATMAYHRMGQDNELIAARAGGLSHRTLLVPALITGLVLAVGLGALSDQVIPRFLSRMEEMVTRDVAQLLVRQIERGHPVSVDNFEIYADGARLVEEEREGINAIVALDHVAAVETDKEGLVKSDVTSRLALFVVFDSSDEMGDGAAEPGLRGAIVLEDAIGYDGNSGTYMGGGRLQFPLTIPHSFDDDPKFLTGGELRALRSAPERMSFVSSRRDTLVRRLAAIDSVASMGSDFAEGSPVTMSGAGGRSIRLFAGGLFPMEGRWRIAPPTGEGQIRYERIRTDANGGRRIDVITARDGYLRLDDAGSTSLLLDRSDEPATLAFRIDAEDVTQRFESGGPQEAAEASHRSIYDAGLTLRYNPLATYQRMSSPDLIAAARTPKANWPDYAGAILDNPAKDLAKRIERLDREITSKLNERWATATSCFVMVMVGAIMAMKLSGALPLVVYLWSFFPALATVLLISMGQQHAHRESIIVGLPILWLGVIGLAGYGAAVLADVSQN